jgi:uncharacterized protein involved in exopolysaccharide biosynthesis
MQAKRNLPDSDSAQQSQEAIHSYFTRHARYRFLLKTALLIIAGVALLWWLLVRR